MFNNIRNKVRHETAIQELEGILCNKRFETKLLALQIKSIEQNIKQFVDEYYKSVGDLLSHSQNIPVRTYGFTENKTTSDDKVVVDNSILNLEIKNIYKKLVLICHQDVTKEYSQELFIKVNSAYQNKDLYQLLKLEKEITNIHSCQDHNVNYVQRLLRLKEEYKAILSHWQYLYNKKERLLNSPAYLLRQKVHSAKKQGIDLIERIKSNLKSHT